MSLIDEGIQKSANLLVEYLELGNRKKYNITRDDGWRFAFAKIRNRPSKINHITDEEIKEVKELHKSGNSYTQIGKILGVTRGRILRIVAKAQKYHYKPNTEMMRIFTPKVIKLRKKGYSHYQIRTKLHTSAQLVTLVLKKHKMTGERHSRKFI